MTLLQSCCKRCSTSSPCIKQRIWYHDFHHERKKQKKVVTETRFEPATNRSRALADRLVGAAGVDNIPGSLFLESATEIRYRFEFLSCSVRFFISQLRVFDPKTEHESFFLGRWSRVCGWRFCEIQKKSGLINYAREQARLLEPKLRWGLHH